MNNVMTEKHVANLRRQAKQVREPDIVELAESHELLRAEVERLKGTPLTILERMLVVARCDNDQVEQAIREEIARLQSVGLEGVNEKQAVVAQDATPLA